MSTSLDIAESQWRTQLIAMRQAIADLKLNSDDVEAPGYGQDLEVEDDDDCIGGVGLDDIWDISSDQGLSDFSSLFDEDEEPAYPESAFKTDDQNLTWLRHAAQTFVRSKPSTDAEDLVQQLLAMLTADMKGTPNNIVIW